MRGSLTGIWWLPLDNINYKDIDEASEVKNADLLDVNAPAYGVPHPSVANYLTVNLAEMKAMSQELADLFGLSLPEADLYTNACQLYGQMPDGYSQYSHAYSLYYRSRVYDAMNDR